MVAGDGGAKAKGTMSAQPATAVTWWNEVGGRLAETESGPQTWGTAAVLKRLWT